MQLLQSVVCKCHTPVEFGTEFWLTEIKSHVQLLLMWLISMIGRRGGLVVSPLDSGSKSSENVYVSVIGNVIFMYIRTNNSFHTHQNYESLKSF